MKSVRVSVIIPCYNYGHYLAEAVDSVIHQTVQNFEIIVVNDGSSDDTRQVAENLIRKYPHHRIKLINQVNQGLSASRNNGIKISVGEYILPLDADDKIAPTFLEETVRALDSDPHIAIAYTHLKRFGEKQEILLATPYDFNKLGSENQLSYCSLYRRQAWEAVGGYDEDMRLGYEDWNFWIGCGEKGYFAKLLPKPLFFYRVHSDSMYNKSLKLDLQLKAQIAANHPQLYSADTLTWSELYQRYQKDPFDYQLNTELIAYYIDRKNDWASAVPHLLNGLRKDPSDANLTRLTGVAYLKLYKTEEAAGYLRKALDIRPDDYQAHFYFALSQLLLEKDGEAERHLQDTIELKPDWPDPHVLLASIYLLGGKVQEATRLLNDALDFESNKQVLNKFIQETKSNNQVVADYFKTILSRELLAVPSPVLEIRSQVASNGTRLDPPINGLLIEARAQKKEKRFKEAIVTLEKAKTFLSNKGMAGSNGRFDRLVQQARAHKRRKEFEHAIKNLEEAKALLH